MSLHLDLEYILRMAHIRTSYTPERLNWYPGFYTALRNGSVDHQKELVTYCFDESESANNRGFTTVTAVLVPDGDVNWITPVVAFNDISETCIDEYCQNKGSHRPPKHINIGHAETGLIAEAARVGIRTENAIVALNWFPCLNCADMLAKARIKQVLCIEPDWDYRKNDYDFRGARDLMLNHGIELVYVRVGIR